MTQLRDDLDVTGLLLAATWARRGTCLRRRVGCVLFDEYGHAIGAGYNGRASGIVHCTERGDARAGQTTFLHACAGAFSASGTQLDQCEAIHAEANALISCERPQAIRTCYVTHSPCITCATMLMNTPCRRVVFATPYAHDEPAKKRWLASTASGSVSPRVWHHLPHPLVAGLLSGRVEDLGKLVGAM